MKTLHVPLDGQQGNDGDENDGDGDNDPPDRDDNLELHHP